MLSHFTDIKSITFNNKGLPVICIKQKSIKNTSCNSDYFVLPVSLLFDQETIRKQNGGLWNWKIRQQLCYWARSQSIFCGLNSVCYDMEFWLNPQQHAVKRIPNDFVAAKWLLYWGLYNWEKNCLQKVWYFVPKIVLTYCEKNVLVIKEKLLKFKGRIFFFEITRTIYSKVSTIFETTCFFNLCLEVLRSNTLEQIEFKVEKLIGI